MAVDTREQRIDAMPAAQLSLDAPPPATRVSATRIFFIGRYVPPHGQHAGPGPPWRLREGAERGAERSETSEPRCARHSELPSAELGAARKMESASTSVAVLPPCFPGKNKRSALSGQPHDLIGGAKRDRTVDLYNAIV